MGRKDASMTKSFVFAMFCLGAVGQQTTRVNHSRLPVDDALFENCSSIETIAQQHDVGGPEQAYSIELYPKYAGSPVFPFLSEQTIGMVTRWLGAERRARTPLAIMYSVAGRSLLKCRDTSGALHEISSSSGSPLDLEIAGMSAKILHFDFYNKKMAHVYVVATAALDAIDGADVLDRVTRLLGARFVFLYIRNDPWFYGYSPDSSPYMFTDLSNMLTEEQYLKTQTMSCMTTYGCHLGPSWP
jgi:hypothetical protein